MKNATDDLDLSQFEGMDREALIAEVKRLTRERAELEADEDSAMEARQSREEKLMNALQKQEDRIAGEMKFHPCKCTSYNGGQCYNCLNGAHSYCSKCRKRNSKRTGLLIVVNKAEP